jgi:hypothetical protein
MAGGNINEAVVPNAPENFAFPAYWDAEMRAYEYLDEFLRTYPNWRQQLTNDIAAAIPSAPANLTPTHLLGSPGNNIPVRDEIIYVLDQAPDRQDRFQEILSQHSGEGAISYFLGMLMIDPSRMPAMNLLIRVARRIGEHIVMVLKGQFRCPRPSQLCAAVVPMIDPPATPAYPSGHSLQSQLIARAIAGATGANAIPGVPAIPGTNLSIVPRHLIFDLADRIGHNRIIAGLHYQNDHIAGVAVANWCYVRLLTPLAAVAAPPASRLNRLMAAVNLEIANMTNPQPAP